MSEWHPGMPAEYRNTIVVGDARVLAERIPDASVDVIFTDPPYPLEYLGLYQWLAETGARVLKPGGSVFALAGHYYFPQVLDAMRLHLDYHWLCAVYQPTVTHSYRCFPKRLDVYWKPLLWFTKGRYAGPFLMDGVNSKAPDKRFHQWGQDERWARQFIERFPRDWTVLEPFAGGGTIPSVCRQHRVNCVAFEVDPGQAAIARERVRLTPEPLLVVDAPDPQPVLLL